MSIEFLTFGCRLNAYESEAMRALAEEAGLQDVIVVNSCAVTAEAERQVRQAVRKAHREAPEKKIIVTGCASQLNKQAWEKMPGVVQVVDNAAKLQAAGRAFKTEESQGAEALPGAVPLAPGPVGFGSRVRAFVQIQQGCDHSCTFCIIPQGRGKSRSFDKNLLIGQIRELAAAGFQEIGLTGVDLTSYSLQGGGSEDGEDFGLLLKMILDEVPELPALRLSSLDPAALGDSFWRVFAEEERLMPHLHFSFQAGSDLILKRMKRRHSRSEALALVKKARRLRPNCALGGDFIAGFPTETDDLFQETLDFVAEAALPFLHIFPYSVRQGTPAAKMPQVPVQSRKERAARLRETGQKNAQAYFNGFIGQEITVLPETPRKGHSSYFIMTEFAEDVPLGQPLRAKAYATSETGLLAAYVGNIGKISTQDQKQEGKLR